MKSNKNVTLGYGIGEGIQFGASGIEAHGLKGATADKFELLKILLGSLSVLAGVSFLFWFFTALLGGSLEALGFVPTAEPANLFGCTVGSFIISLISLLSLMLTKFIENDYKRLEQLSAGNSMLRKEMCRKCKSKKALKDSLEDVDEDVDDYVSDLEDTVKNLREQEKGMRLDISSLKMMLRELYAHCVSKTPVDSWFPVPLTSDKDWVSSFNNFMASCKKTWEKEETEDMKED